MPRSGYKHPQVLHKCALLSPVPLLSGRHTNSADALRLRNLPPLAMRRLAAPMKAVAGYLAWLDLAQLGLAWLGLLAGCRFIIISAAQLADAFQSCLCARAAQT